MNLRVLCREFNMTPDQVDELDPQEAADRLLLLRYESQIAEASTK